MLSVLRHLRRNPRQNPPSFETQKSCFAKSHQNPQNHSSKPRPSGSVRRRSLTVAALIELGTTQTASQAFDVAGFTVLVAIDARCLVGMLPAFLANLGTRSRIRRRS